jgi:phosphoribosylanthranilate isomerase
MRVKICGIKNENDVQTVIKSDADAAGFLVGQVHASKDFILPSTAARLADSLPPYITPVLVTHLTDPEEIMELVMKTGITTVQLHGGSSVKDVKKLRDLMPLNSKLVLAAYIKNKRCTPELEEYYPFIDAVLLDSYNEEKGQVGGTGKIHDWELSSEIVAMSPLPVILAGGLNPSNVADAVRTVKPFAVDANSGLKDESDGRSLEKCIEFVRNAKGR